VLLYVETASGVHWNRRCTHHPETTYESKEIEGKKFEKVARRIPSTKEAILGQAFLGDRVWSLVNGK